MTAPLQAECAGELESSPLRKALMETMVQSGCSMKALTVLAAQNDPFRLDTPARHRDGEWLAVTARALGYTGGHKIHLRGLHYAITRSKTPVIKPDGKQYLNIDSDWAWLSESAAKAARFLGYIPFDEIVDQRNTPPVVRTFEQPDPWPYINVGIDVTLPSVADIVPLVGIADFIGVQPYKLVLIGEKSSLDEPLAPVAQDYSADLYLPTGCLSDTLCHQIARTGAEDGRPMVVLYFADCDPSGWNMGIEVARKLQAFKVALFPELSFQVHRVALVPDQVREYGLPSTPLKDSERRADRWTASMHVAQTEIDALTAPDMVPLLQQIAAEAIAPFYDSTLDARVDRARRKWIAEAQAVIDSEVDGEHLQQLRTDAGEKLAAMRAEIAAINDALRIDAHDFDLPAIVVPDAQHNGRSNGTPLVDSDWSFAEQCRRLIDSKAYRRDEEAS